MHATEYEAIMRDMLEAARQGDWSLFDRHPGLAETKPTVMMMNQAMPDVRTELVLFFTNGEWVASRWVWAGTDTGGFMGRPPTGKFIQYEVLHMHQFRDGIIVKQHAQADAISLLQQLGAI